MAMYPNVRPEYSVSPIVGDWDVRLRDRVLSHHGCKRDAVKAAAKLARAHRPSALVIRRCDGSVEARRFYGSSAPATNSRSGFRDTSKGARSGNSPER